jgi:cysteine desulfurase
VSAGQLVTTASEHRGARALAARHEAGGGAVELIRVDASGAWRLDEFEPRRDAVALLTIASGEFGTEQNLSALREMWREAEAGALILDAVQAAASQRLNFDEIGADHLVIGSAKLEGPAGIAALISAPDRRLRPLVAGGGQERGRRGGTEAVPLAAAFALALVLSVREREATRMHLRALSDAFTEGLGVAETHGLRLTGSSDRTKRLPGHHSFAASWVLGDDLVAALDHAGLAISTGSACISGSREPSEALMACGHSLDEARGGIRISFGRTNSVDEARRAAAIVATTCSQIRKGSRVETTSS